MMTNPTSWIDGRNTITIEFKDHVSWSETKPIIIHAAGPCLAIQSIDWINPKTAIITTKKNISLDQQLYLEWGEDKLPIYPREVVRTAWFDQTYNAMDEQLGCVYSPEKTSFSVWAPTAIQMDLVLENDRIAMTRKSNGVWHTIITGDLKNVLYHFAVTVLGEEKHVNDPYAKGMTANSTRSVVLDLEASDPTGFRTIDYPKISKQDAIIYELHIRDATSSAESGVQHKGKFLGLTEKNTKSPEGFSSGLSYIKELGCTHVQLLPVQDFARVNELKPKESYNWGYDPLFYFVPEGSYATDAKQPLLRVHECKRMIQAIHQEGMSVILDVVYNHVFCYEESALEKLVPGYYFRYREDGSISNGTGTGNDLATERNMVRKLILDAIDYWLTEYQIDGFRFDLMGAMDVETMQNICSRCLQEERPILLLGEGWDLETPLLPEQKATISQSEQLLDVSYFNDYFRDSLKGNLFHMEDKGYVNGNGHYIERLPQLVAGSCDKRFGGKIFSNPLQSINYVECHDNHTLSDRLMLSNPDATEESRKRMHQLATGITILSQGIPFLHAGQEFFRTKLGEENSYLSGDYVNQMNWLQRSKEDENVWWVRSLILLRKTYSLFRLRSAKEIQKRLHIVAAPNPVFGYMLVGEDDDFVIFANPLNSVMKIEIPAPGRWEKLISNHASYISPICSMLQTSTEIGAYELAIWKKSRV